jgi:sarcosine oxidase gamma subunit
MLSTSTTITNGQHRVAVAAPNTTISALSLALDDAQARLDAALDDLRALVAGGELTAADARALEDEYAARHLRRVATLEERGALACTPDEWCAYVAQAGARRARIDSARSRRERLRVALAARQCLVVAAGRIAEPTLVTFAGAEPDDEILEIRAELAAAQLL